MRVTPRTEEEIKRSKLLAPGECDFEVRDAKDETSKSNNEMIHLILDVWDSNGDKALVHDYLLDAMPHKVRHFCYAVGLGHVYENGELEADACIGKSGRCLIRSKQDRGYDPKNDVADYVVADSTKETKGYATAKAKQQASGKDAGATLAAERQAAMRTAWETWKRKFTKEFPQSTQVECETAWKAACAAYWPNQKIPDAIGTVQWDQLVKNEFRRPEGDLTPAGTHFTGDEDVPF